MAIDIFCHQHSMFVKLIALVYPWYLFPLSLSLSWTTTYVTKFCLTNTFWHVWSDGVIIHIFQVVVSCWHIKCNHCAKNNIFITIWGTHTTLCLLEMWTTPITFEIIKQKILHSCTNIPKVRKIKNVSSLLYQN